MAKESNIEWTDATANLWWGCSKVHTGCKNCYAEFLSDTRYKNGLWGENASRRRIKSAFRDLTYLQRISKVDGTIRRVFVGSMMDIFEEPKPLENEEGTTKEIRDLLFKQINLSIQSYKIRSSI